MNIQTLQIPTYFRLPNVLDFVQQARSIPEDCTILSLDFGGWSRCMPYELPLEPFGMLIVSQAINQLRQRIPNAIVAPVSLPGNEIVSYAAHMGFFQSCEIPLGKLPGQARGGQTYLPITHYEEPGYLVTGAINDMSLDLARKLTQQHDGALVRTLQFSFSEIIRNVAEHSRAKSFWYCAQYWDSKGEAEIALLDDGQGLKSSLQMNPHLSDHLVDDRAALKYALMPGISGKMYPGKPSNPNDPTENTGFGLYMNYRICNEGGSFFIASGDSGLYRRRDEENGYFDYTLPGVALRLKMQVQTLEQYESHYHHLFLQDGEREAKKIGIGNIPTGDKLSQMLRSGFRESSSEDKHE